MICQTFSPQFKEHGHEFWCYFAQITQHVYEIISHLLLYSSHELMTVV